MKFSDRGIKLGLATLFGAFCFAVLAIDALEPVLAVAGGAPTSGEILIVGGGNSTGLLTSTELYDPATSTFALAATMNVARGSNLGTLQYSLLASGPNAGKVLIIGGVNNANAVLASTELYDPATNTFAPTSATPTMNVARDAPAALLASGQVLVAGGIATGAANPYDNYLASTELYDPLSNTFAPPGSTATMSNRRSDPTATLLTVGPNSGKVLVAGGANYAYYDNTTELYDPTTNSFAFGPSMNSARYAATAITLTSGPNSGCVLIVGGKSTVGEMTSTELYNPVTDTFAPAAATATMNVGTSRAAAITLVSGPNAGKILIAGGNGPPDNGIRASTELYDPATNTFAPPAATATMNVSLEDASGSLLMSGPTSGWVLLAGGFDGSAALASTELYDSATNSFVAAAGAPVMNIARSDPTAIQLPGTVCSQPTTKNACKDGGWQNFCSPSFKNQGECVSWVNHNT